MSKLNWERFKLKFHQSWWEKMQPWIESGECYDIYQQLKTSEKEIFPMSGDLWRAFRDTDYNNLKCIVVGQSPYHTYEGDVPYADGLAFSCSYTKKLSPSLKVLYEAIADDLDVRTVNKEPDLTYLAIQDVLLLNLSLTIDKGDKDSFEKHEVMWQPFIEHLFNNVLDTVTGVPILLFGTPAREAIMPHLHESQPVKCLKHPAYYARKEEPMEHGNCFSWASGVALGNNGEEIYWDCDDYYAKGLPF